MEGKREIQVTTKTGDKGESSLFSGERRRKSSIVFETLGAIDELNAQMGAAKAQYEEGERRSCIDELQGYGMKAAGRVAAIGEAPAGCSGDEIDRATQRLEEIQRGLSERLESPEGFVRPGKDQRSAQLHVARTVCRRAERMIIRCMDEEQREELGAPQKFLNRLADLLFVLALAEEEGV